MAVVKATGVARDGAQGQVATRTASVAQSASSGTDQRPGPHTTSTERPRMAPTNHCDSSSARCASLGFSDSARLMSWCRVIARVLVRASGSPGFAADCHDSGYRRLPGRRQTCRPAAAPGEQCFGYGAMSLGLRRHEDGFTGFDRDAVIHGHCGDRDVERLSRLIQPVRQLRQHTGVNRRRFRWQRWRARNSR